ncbi:hypothetical protein HJC23_001153 [Cyclotella cryptica]|uniref:Uncharacterized protein n=1 Tax=Cyclotella cryptica TaxID=29204 RepID=A0ABD3P7A9_9STRA
MACLTDTMAFTPNLSTSKLRPSTWLHADAEKIKKAGAGIATSPPGILYSFDPNENGKLQGTGNVNDRISKGASYMSAQPKAAAASPSISTSSLRDLVSPKSQY